MTPTETVTVAGKSFSMPCPFDEGHVLTAGEASQLNQVYHENLRNNVSKKIKDAVIGGTFDQSAFQTIIDNLAASYEFGKRRAGGPRAPSDPVAKEALKLAISAIEAHLRSQNKKPSDFSNIKDLAAKLVASNESFTEKAREIVAQRQEAADATLGGILDSLETKAPATAVAA